MTVLKIIDDKHRIETGIYVDPKGKEHEMLYFNTYKLVDPSIALKKAFLKDEISQAEYTRQKELLADSKPSLEIDKWMSKAFSKTKLKLIREHQDIVDQFIA